MAGGQAGPRTWGSSGRAVCAPGGARQRAGPVDMVPRRQGLGIRETGVRLGGGGVGSQGLSSALHLAAPQAWGGAVPGPGFVEEGPGPGHCCPGCWGERGVRGVGGGLLSRPPEQGLTSPRPTAPAGAAGGNAATSPAWAPVWPTGTATSSTLMERAKASRGAASTRWPRYVALPLPRRLPALGQGPTSLRSPSQDHCGVNGSASGTFRIVTENVPCGTTGVTCSKAIKLFLEVRALGPSPPLCSRGPNPVRHPARGGGRGAGPPAVAWCLGAVGKKGRSPWGHRTEKTSPRGSEARLPPEAPGEGPPGLGQLLGLRASVLGLLAASPSLCSVLARPHLFPERDPVTGPP